jgi:hypothetical protein
VREGGGGGGAAAREGGGGGGGTGRSDEVEGHGCLLGAC